MNRALSVRALAAESLADIAIAGHSLREVADRALPRLLDARDRALLTALLNDGARWWPRFDAALDRLLGLSGRDPAWPGCSADEARSRGEA